MCAGEQDGESETVRLQERVRIGHNDNKSKNELNKIIEKGDNKNNEQILNIKYTNVSH